MYGGIDFPRHDPSTYLVGTEDAESHSTISMLLGT